MRYHELALVRWINQWAIVREGYPVPTVLSNPTDAFGHFAQLWADPNNPFAYLFQAKDEQGTPLYQPHPAPARYPIISVHRKGWKFRPGQNFSIHRWRHLNWPTVSDVGATVPGRIQQGTGLTKADLGEVTTARRPMAWDYRFQIDHFCNRPDTQAFFLQQLMEQLWRSGGTPQTWISVPYPGYGDMLVRLYLDGDIESATPEEPPDDRGVEFRTSFSVTLEGFMVDLRFKVYPALWRIVMGSGSVAPEDLRVAFTEDLRQRGTNVTLEQRDGAPLPSLDLRPVNAQPALMRTAQVPPDLDRSVWRSQAEAVVLNVDLTTTWAVVEPGP